MRDVILHGDCLAFLKTLEANSVDALCCDPPAGISFMGKEWDNPNLFPTRQRPESYAGNFGRSMTSGPEWSYNKRARDTFIAFLTEVMAECLRVVKPGGHALIWALPRTSHWTATALEDAGWEIRDCLTHVFGQGFPKSLDISKAIDKQARAEREVLGKAADFALDGARRAAANHRDTRKVTGFAGDMRYGWDRDITAPATPEAQRWSGFGSALKPASEHWILARKPLACANLASNVLAWGTGGINVDGCRVGTDRLVNRGMSSLGVMHDDEWKPKANIENAVIGRWPPNLLLSHSLACTPHACCEECAVRLLDEQAGERKSGPSYVRGSTIENKLYNSGLGYRAAASIQQGYDDAGGVSRFFPVFYAAKASRRERNEGCEALPEQYNDFQRASSGLSRSSNDKDGSMGTRSNPASNHHPTVKPLALMRWLVRLITPPGGIVLDCFAGSGSTLVACIQEGLHYIGMEQDASYIEIARARVAHATPAPPKPRAKITRLPKRPALAEQLSLFAEVAG